MKRSDDNFKSILFVCGVWLTLLYLFVSSMTKGILDDRPGSLLDYMGKTKELISGHR